jgi:hypothetical protein
MLRASDGVVSMFTTLTIGSSDAAATSGRRPTPSVRVGNVIAEWQTLRIVQPPGIGDDGAWRVG